MSLRSRDPLPRHPLPTAIRERTSRGIRIDGLVALPLTVLGAHVAGLPRHEVQEDFICQEGWSVAGLRWRGVRLADVLALARPLPGARYVRVASANYRVPIALPDATKALLCEELDGAELAMEQGGPWRLLIPGADCFTSVKWVDRLELTAEPGAATGEQIARARLSPLAG